MLYGDISLFGYLTVGVEIKFVYVTVFSYVCMYVPKPQILWLFLSKNVFLSQWWHRVANLNNKKQGLYRSANYGSYGRTFPITWKKDYFWRFESWWFESQQQLVYYQKRYYTSSFLNNAIRSHSLLDCIVCINCKSRLAFYPSPSVSFLDRKSRFQR